MDRRSFTPVIVYLSEHVLSARNNKSLFEELGIEITGYSYSKWQLQLHASSIARHIQQKFYGRKIIFHAHGYYPTLILSNMKGVQTMATIHNICDQDFTLKKGRWMGTYMAWRFKKALERLNLCVPICHSMQDYYAAGGKLTLKTVCNGVEERGMATAGEKEAVRKLLGINSDVKVFLYPASFSSLKNHQFIINELKDSPHRDFLILFAGQGELEEECKKMTGNDPRFRFLGYQMNLDQYWKIADFMISSSYSEGMPLAVLEAVVQGLPCLLSGIPAHLEILRNVFGSEEMSFDANRRGSLSQLVDIVIHQEFPREQIRQKAVSLYSLRTMYTGYEEIYSQLSKQCYPTS